MAHRARVKFLQRLHNGVSFGRTRQTKSTGSRIGVGSSYFHESSEGIVDRREARRASALRLGPVEVFVKEAEGVVGEDGVAAVEELNVGSVGDA